MAVRRRTSRILGFARRSVPPAVTAALCVAVSIPPDALSQPRTSHPGSKKQAAVQLTPGQKALHALNRFTFGPRPGDLDEVRVEGVEAWFQQQLHPERLPDDAFAARLTAYPAMQLSQTELVARFPTPGMLRRYSRGGALSFPADPIERAIYEDGAFRYQEKIKDKQATMPDAASSPGAMALTAGRDAVPAPIVRIEAGQRHTEPPTPASSEADAASTKDAVLALAPELRLQKLASMPPAYLESFDALVKGPDRARLLAGLNPQQAEQVAALRSPERLIDSEVLSSRLLRDVYSQRQLQAVMTDFWLNHFNVYLRKNQNEPYYLPAYERDAILPNALGSFEDLLIATAKSPAMLVYLDNWESIGPSSKVAVRAASGGATGGTPKAGKSPKGINENYARELMELHTLGVGGGYTQQDVIEVAKCFTGWTVEHPDEGGEFQFNPARHEPGPKTVLGHLIPESGMNEGLTVLHLLATSPATAHFVSEKLAERFVSDAPPRVLVDRMAATFLKSDGDIGSVLTTLFHSPEFWSPQVYRAKVKTPLEFAASALRATEAEVSNPAPAILGLDRLGMPLFGMQTPNGYSWRADAWVSSNALLTRMNFALVLSGNHLGGTRVSWPALLGGDSLPDELSNEDAERRLEQVLLGQAAAPQTRAAALQEATLPTVQQQAQQDFLAIPVNTSRYPPQANDATVTMRVRAGRTSPPVAAPETPLATMAGLLLGSPDFQRR